jgi:hypothetical protein
MIIINLLALLVILGAGAVAGVLLTIRYAEHRHADGQADEDRPRPQEPSAFDGRDRLPI